MEPLIVPNIAHESHETFQFENLFRSIQYAITDHCSFEYLFICDFFIANEQLAFDLFNKIMGRSIEYITRILEEKISINYDAISLYICVCLCKRYLLLIKERKVLAMESYFDSLCLLLWARLEHVMNLHIESLRSHGKKSPQSSIQTPDTRPYYVVRRCAELTASLLLCSQSFCKENDNRLLAILSKLQSDVENLINRFASQLRSRKDQLVFQINNYDLILSVLNERVTTETNDKCFFEDLLKSKTSAFVEELIKAHFSSVIQFLNEYDALLSQDQTQLLSKYAGKVSQVVSSFNKNWQHSIRLIKDETQSFTSFKNGAYVFSKVIEHIYCIYERLSKVVTTQSIQINETIVVRQKLDEVISSYQNPF